MPPSLIVSNTDSLGEQIQRTFPSLKVIKTLNTVNCKIMVEPSLVPGEHNMFISGNDADAKRQVIDLGDITGARVAEMYVLL